MSSLLPSERAKAAGAPVEVDIGKLEPGQMMTVEWRGKPVWIINRNKEMLETLPKLDDAVADPKSGKQMQPDYARNETRSIKPEIAGGRRHLHAPRLFAVAEVQEGCRRRHAPSGLRLPLPLPRFDFSISPVRVKGQTRTDQPRSSAALLHVR